MGLPARSSLLLTLLAGCHAIYPYGAAAPDGGRADARDVGPAGPTDAPRDCLSRWFAEPRFGEPELLVALNSAGAETEPFLAPDGLTLYFSSARAGGKGSFDVYEATRPTPDAPFGQVRGYDTVNTDGSETRFALARGGRTAFLAAAVVDSPTRTDLFEATRADASQPFARADFRALNFLNSGDDDFDPWPTADAGRVYYCRRRQPAAATEIGELLVAQRDAAAGVFTSVVPVAGLQRSGAVRCNPTLTPDERVILFTSDEPGGAGDYDIWYATRADATQPFAQPRTVPGINTALRDFEPFLTPDGCTIYFSSNRGGDPLDHALYRVTMLPGA